jgi:DNA primase
MDIDPTTTKYLIKASMKANGVVEKPDVIGAIFGQTEGLLGDELDLRDLQKSGRIGRIEVETDAQQGNTEGSITLPSSLDKVETSILAAALESIDRIGPCEAQIEVDAINDVRESKRARVADRAKELLETIGEGDSESAGAADIVEEVKKDVKVEELVSYGSEHLPAGPNVSSSDSIIVVEGRSDVANLLTNGIKNAIATEGTSIPSTVRELSKERVTTAFVDGDRGGKLLLQELLQTADIDFVAQAPDACEVEELTQKQVMKAVRNKLPVQQFIEEHDLDEPETEDEAEDQTEPAEDETTEPETEQEPEQEPEPEPEDEPDEHEQEVPGEADEDTEQEPDTGKESLDFYKRKLGELSGDLEGVLVDDDDQIVQGPIPVRDLADKLRDEGDGVRAVIFDGVITQRLLDIASEKGIRTVIGMKMGNVTKQPDSVDVYTDDDL